MFVPDFSLEGRLFHILGPKNEGPFCHVLLLRKGRFCLANGQLLRTSPTYMMGLHYKKIALVM